MEFVTANGGFARKRELVAIGAHDRDLTAAVKSGALIRVRNGWYSTVDERDVRLRAMRVGGRLTGASLLIFLGAWIRFESVLHVSVPSNAARLRSQWNRRRRSPPRTGERVHWESEKVGRRGTRTAVDIRDALRTFVLGTTLEQAIAALDWATHTGQLDRVDFEQFILDLPCRLWPLGRWVDRECQSYAESIGRTRIRVRGYRVRSQVPVGDLEAIDLVVEDVVGIEIDGEEHHLDSFVADREKDLRITLEGRHPLRIPFVTLESAWPMVLAAIDAALHSRGRRPDLAARQRGARRADANTPVARIGRRGRLHLPAIVQ